MDGHQTKWFREDKTRRSFAEIQLEEAETAAKTKELLATERLIYQMQVEDAAIAAAADRRRQQQQQQQQQQQKRSKKKKKGRHGGDRKSSGSSGGGSSGGSGDGKSAKVKKSKREVTKVLDGAAKRK